MSHQINVCDCGRIIHWPKNAVPGKAKWTCRVSHCRRTYRLVPAGTPGADTSGVQGEADGRRTRKLVERRRRAAASRTSSNRSRAGNSRRPRFRAP